MSVVLQRDGVTDQGARLPFNLPRLGAEQTNHQNHVVEMALAHTIGDKVEAAYRRGDLLEKRRELMDDGRATVQPEPALARLPRGLSSARKSAFSPASPRNGRSGAAGNPFAGAGSWR